MKYLSDILKALLVVLKLAKAAPKPGQDVKPLQ
jgi:hypothetical protein